MSDIVRHVVIRGRVQGVGFRAFVEYTARDHGLAGWVRNRRDGSVEAVFAGPPQTVAMMFEDCRRGPPGSRVDSVEELGVEFTATNMESGHPFVVLPTI